ncbi:D-serine dehydratase [Neobacillus rhizosphaerae]|uniref:Probable D-serine dehydratase n=1 Tax=Neobacillus rhizosphaerae TaxID=2880965 RepID=A0ABM9ER62_9BACI|nr:D-serine ammonia-lyase [Neobacillus rhizosphaerae]CAH2715107.1 D-serine dehydratase [Neobacillus rhizosphaerae]
MENKIIQGHTIKEWEEKYPLMSKIISTDEVFWTNSKYEKFTDAIKKISLSEKDVEDAEERLNRFAPYIAKVFPETQKTNGIIESPIVPIPNMQSNIAETYNQEILGQLLLKCDSHLAISGSIKARGGIYEVLKHAEDLAIENNMLTIKDDYSIMDSDKFREFFSKYSIAVGSTGNLGLSIGIMSAQLGFKVYVHMSADAKQWKKDLLRSKGVTVIEYESDYSKAVEEGRKQAEADPNMYFIDDENSTNLFLGYSVAAYRLKKQLEEINVVVDENHPLFVYLPCGVGGGPGGVAFGLKLVFKDNVHCFFAEPTHSPCMVLGLMTGLHDKVSVQDFDIDNITDADGLAVGRASGFVGKTLENLISGSYTVNDEQLYILLSMLSDSENIKLEPSALAGIHGPIQLFRDEAGQKYIENNNLKNKIKNVTHIAWATGGSMVPKDVMETYYKKGKEASATLK